MFVVLFSLMCFFQNTFALTIYGKYNKISYNFFKQPRLITTISSDSLTSSGENMTKNDLNEEQEEELMNKIIMHKLNMDKLILLKSVDMSVIKKSMYDFTPLHIENDDIVGSFDCERWSSLRILNVQRYKKFNCITNGGLYADWELEEF